MLVLRSKENKWGRKRLYATLRGPGSGYLRHTTDIRNAYVYTNKDFDRLRFWDKIPVEYDSEGCPRRFR
jgi:hypothetical protein